MQLIVTIWLAVVGTFAAFLALKSYLNHREERQRLLQPPFQPIQITPETLLTAYAVAQWVKKKDFFPKNVPLTTMFTPGKG